jgi:hypothetical protein
MRSACQCAPQPTGQPGGYARCRRALFLWRRSRVPTAPPSSAISPNAPRSANAIFFRAFFMPLARHVGRENASPMIEIRKYIQPEAAFDPETIEVLASAFDDAWDQIRKSGSRFARPGYSRAMREVIARRIIEMAQQGMREQQALAEDSVRFLAANYKDEREGSA